MVVILANNVVINIWYQLRLDRIIFNSYFASKILEILYLVLPIVVYSDLYQHGVVMYSINRQLSDTSIASTSTSTSTALAER